MSTASVAASPRAPHPAWLALLMYPFGAVSGYLSVAIEYDLRQGNVPVEAVGIFIAISFIPNTWKFLWGPVVDVTFSPRIWYTWTVMITALCVLGLGFIAPTAGHMTMLNVVGFLASLAVTFSGMAADIISAHVSPPEQKGRYGGWIQAGNLAGGGVGGGLALWISQNTSEHWYAGAFLAVTFALCPLVLLMLPRIVHSVEGQDAIRRVVHVAKECWGVVRSRAGALAILVLFLPLGTSAASGLWSYVASDWHASADAVGWANGVWSGVASAVGCLLGGYFCDRMERKWAYAVFGLIQAAILVGMGFAPHTQTNFIIGAIVYAVSAGLCYASFCALTLEVIGAGAAATKYNLLASLSNFPIQYMTLVDTWGYKRFGASGMLYVEAAMAVLGTLVYVAVKLGTGRRGESLTAVEPAAL